MFTLVVVSYYFAERRRQESGFLNVHWVLLLAFAAMFLLFGGGMFASSFQLAWTNVTTVENLSRRGKVHYLAVYMSRAEENLRKIEATGRPALRTITYPRPLAETAMILQQHGADVAPLSQSNTNPPPTSDHPVETVDPRGAPNSRTFAILETPPGLNPWNIGAFGNLKSVLGERLVDWVLPLRYSPCLNHDSAISMYKMNPEVHDCIRAAGVELPESVTPRSSHRKRRRRRSYGSHPSEQTDGPERSRSHLSHSHSNGGSAPTRQLQDHG